MVQRESVFAGGNFGSVRPMAIGSHLLMQCLDQASINRQCIGTTYIYKCIYIYIYIESYNYKETYNSYDLSANFFLGTRLQLNTSISFSDNYVLQNDSITQNIGGIGDLNLQFKYQVYNSIQKEDTTKKWIQRITVGSGISLPTGNFNKISIVGFQTEFEANSIIGTPETELDAHLQAGTGSFGYLFFLEYLVSY